MGEACVSYGEDKVCIQRFGRESERKGPFGKLSRREDNIKVDPQEIKWDRRLDGFDSWWEQLIGCGKYGSRKFGKFFDELRNF